MLFVLFPLWITGVIKKTWEVGTDPFIFNIIDGFLRLAIFLIYVISISFLKDIKRVFGYHGAEHKSVFAFENKEVLNVDSVRKYTTLHPRCGTNFMFIVILLSILIISLFTVDTFLERFLVRLIVLPMIASVAYEVMRFLGKHSNKVWAKIFLAPGLFLQKITTREPDDEQLEVAIVALKEVLAAEEDSDASSKEDEVNAR